MTKSLGPKFAAIVAKMRRTTFAPESEVARAAAERMAQRAGMTLEEALRALDEDVDEKVANPYRAEAERRAKEAARKAKKEADEKARQEAERAAAHTARWAARTAAWQARRAATIARFGSKDAALAPCRRELLIQNALDPWRSVNPAYPRWTDRLDGWRNDPWKYAEAPAHIRAAVANAYPLPLTFAEAKAEHDYWTARSDEMEDLIRDCAEDLGMGGLDFAADLRACMVRDLMEKDLHLTTLAELHGRFAMYRASESNNWDIEGALFRDLSALVDEQAHRPATPQPPPEPIRPPLGTSIRDTLTADPSRSDRAIARALGCSPTTVGRIRGQMGLAGAARSVRRGGQIYGMKARAGGGAV